MIKLSLTLLLLAHLAGPGPAYAPVQDSYRVEVKPIDNRRRFW